MAARKKTTAEPEVLLAYKGFDLNWQCREFQFEMGETYKHKGSVSACNSGFHSCENPLDVLNYYSLCDSNFALVEIGGKLDRHSGDSKIASATITLKAELKLPKFIKAGVDYLMAWCKEATKEAETASGHYSQLAASGDSSQLAASGHSSQLAASGDSSQLAASGHSSQLAASGHYSKLAASGHYSKLAASGDSSQLAASGHYSQLAASGDSSQLAASGHYSQLAASGHYSKLAASGHYSKLAASGHYSICMAAAPNCIAKAGKDGAIALAYKDGDRYRICVGYAGEDGIKEDTFYRVVDGKLKEVE